ncbi:MAG: hypothetical protein RL441_702 [Actinomycetota bacterium]
MPVVSEWTSGLHRSLAIKGLFPAARDLQFLYLLIRNGVSNSGESVLNASGHAQND